MRNLESYKKGEMLPAELEEFTSQLMQAKFDNDRKKRWKKILEEDRGVNREIPPVSLKNKSRRIYMWVTAVAAVLLLLFASKPLVDSFMSPSYNQLADQYISENFFENRDVTKGDQDIEQINLKAIFAYNQQDFSTAILNFKTIIASGSANDEHYLFLGLSYLYDKQYKNATQALSKVANLYPDTKFIEETHWFLALAHLKNNSLKEGKSILFSIKQGMWNYDKAQELLKTME